ncbi:nucleoside-diphosphate kinase, partial [Treponema sp.]|uniref:nucleoside-diphosphate kinase n=1 Tax=Treponema sp. TaxID=166 RepID=UPI003890ACF9
MYRHDLFYFQKVLYLLQRRLFVHRRKILKFLPLKFPCLSIAKKIMVVKCHSLLYNNRIMTRCFAMCKPGVLNRRLIGQVITRLENKGLKLVGLKLMNISPELASKHYAE